MYVRHVGQTNKVLMVSDSYLQVHDNYDNYDAQTGINAPLTFEEFADALAAASTYDITIIVDKSVAITDDVEVPSNVHLIVRKGGSFAISTGKTLTVSGTLDSCGQDAATIFTGAGSYVHTTITNWVSGVELQQYLTQYTRMLYLSGYCTDLTHGCQQPVQFEVTRSADYAMTGENGVPDMALKVRAYNRSASGVFGRTRAMEVTGELRDNGSAGLFVEAAMFTAKTRSGTTVTDVCVSRFVIDHGASGSGNIVGVQVQDVSQSATGTMYGILLNTSSYAITREYGIFIDSLAGSWTNAISFNGAITYPFDFENTDGSNGAGYDAGFTGPAGYAVPDGYIKVDVGGNPSYIYLWDTLPT